MLSLFLLSSSHICVITWKNHSFDYTDFCRPRMSLLFNVLSRLVIAFIPRSKCLLISCLLSPSSSGHLWSTVKRNWSFLISVQFSSVSQSCPTLWNPMDCSTPGFPVHHQLLEFTQTHVHWISDAIQPSHPLSFPSAPAFNLSQHQGLFQWVSSSNQVAKVLEFQLQHQSFQWKFRVDFFRIDWFDLLVSF